MKPTARTLLLALSLLPCRAGGSEFHLTALQQQGRGSALFSSGAYRTVAFSYLYEPAQDPSGPAVQVCFSAASGSTGGTRNANESNREIGLAVGVAFGGPNGVPK